MTTPYTPTKAEQERAAAELAKLEAGRAKAAAGVSIRIAESRFEHPSPGIPTFWRCWLVREMEKGGKTEITKVCYSLSHTGRCVNVGDPRDNVFSWDGADQASYAVL